MLTVRSGVDERSDAIDVYYELNVKQSLMQAGYYMIACTFLGNCCVQLALLVVGTKLVGEHTMAVSTLLAFMLYQGQLLEYFNNLVNSFTGLIRSAGAGAKVLDISTLSLGVTTDRKQTPDIVLILPRLQFLQMAPQNRLELPLPAKGFRTAGPKAGAVRAWPGRWG